MLSINGVGPIPAKIMIVGDMPGAMDLKTKIPFSGSTGDLLNRMLSNSGLNRLECYITMAIKSRPFDGKIEEFMPEKKKDATPDCVLIQGKLCKPVVQESLAQLKREIEAVKPTIIIALGKTAMWALTGSSKLSDWRGSITDLSPLMMPSSRTPRVLPTFHPGAMFRQPELSSVMELDLKRVQSLLDFKPRTERFIIEPDYDQATDYLTRILNELNQHPMLLSVDIETFARTISCIGFAWSTEDAICIPFTSYTRLHYWSREEENQITFYICQILAHKNVQIIGQNFQYDAQYLYRYFRFIPRCYHDTMIGHHICFPFTPGGSKDSAASPMKKSLGFLSSIYCDTHVYWKDELGDAKKEFDDRKEWTYNCRDCVVTYEIALKELKSVEEFKLQEQNTFQQRLALPILRSMIRGIRISHDTRKKLYAKYQAQIKDAQERLNYVVGYELNVNSGVQMKDLFYEQLALPVQKDRKTKSVTCDEQALERLALKQPLVAPLVNMVKEIRGGVKLCSTYLIDKTGDDKRMHCSFNPAGTETFRFSSSTDAFGSGMNLQNIPGELRKMFIPDPGYEFFDTDLSSADLHLVAWESGEPELKQLLREGKSVYLLLAREYFNDPTIAKKLPSGEDDPRYKMFKSFCHGSNYLGTPEGLALNLGLSIPDAIRAQKWYFSRFPNIALWQKRFKEQLLDTKQVRNIFGYRIHFFGRIEGNVFNQAIAWLPQSTVACIINRVYARIDELLPEVHVLIQCHDSLAGQYPLDNRDHWREKILEQSVVTLPYADPIAIPIGIKSSTVSWGDCK